MELTVGITGASGAIYAQRTLVHLAASGEVERVNLITSQSALVVARVELGVTLREGDAGALNGWLGLAADSKLVRWHRLDNMAAAPASGSHPQAGMIVVPCSMGTLGAIASGAGTNLIHRAADVTLKEGRRLVVVPRETPYNAIHLENMLRLSRAGARILPASPAFYHRPQTITEMVDHLVFRILDQFEVPHTRATEWKQEQAEE
ncbi:MAG TPA: flavin prenyltransferase UbiX [Pyrinomonadaceae bacterium]|jgi:4-hydroxy-3-polyprenylbenzoate decarboxylase